MNTKQTSRVGEATTRLHSRASPVAALLLVVLASAQGAIAAADCSAAPAHHHASVKRRPHHRRPKRPHQKKPHKSAAAKRPSGRECAPKAVTLADIEALGVPEGTGLLAPLAGPAPAPDLDGSDAGPAAPVLQPISFDLPLSDGEAGVGRPGDSGGAPPGGGLSGGDPGGGGYVPPPGGGGSIPGGGDSPGGDPSGVPEPRTWMMLLLGAGAVGAAARGRRASGSLAA